MNRIFDFDEKVKKLDSFLKSPGAAAHIKDVWNPIGSGSYGTVYANKHQIVVKITEETQAEGDILLLLRQALLQSGISPHVVCGRSIGHEFIIMEHASHGSLVDHLIRLKTRSTKDMVLRVVLLQVCFTLAVLQDMWPSFRHNDLMPANILIHKDTVDHGFTRYIFEDREFYVPNLGIQALISDFGFSCIPGVVNNVDVYDCHCRNPQYGISTFKNQAYDTTLLGNILVLASGSNEVSNHLRQDIVSGMLIPSSEESKSIVDRQYRPNENWSFEGLTPREILHKNSNLFKIFSRKSECVRTFQYKRSSVRAIRQPYFSIDIKKESRKDENVFLWLKSVATELYKNTNLDIEILLGSAYYDSKWIIRRFDVGGYWYCGVYLLSLFDQIIMLSAEDYGNKYKTLFTSEQVFEFVEEKYAQEEYLALFCWWSVVIHRLPRLERLHQR